MILDLRWLGIVSMVVIVMAAAVPPLSGPLDWRDSVSRTWTRSRRKWLVLAVLMSLAGTGLCVSLAWWVVPHYHLSALMYRVIAAAYLAFMGVAWIPMTDRPGEHSYWHGHFLGGTVLATLAVVAMAGVLWSGMGVSPVARMLCWVSMVLAAGWPFLFFSSARRMFLVLESVIALAFLVAVTMLLVG
jgi:hypothetical protein